MTDLRVLHYLNQFFGQLGGEEAAGAGPRLLPGPVGPGRPLDGLLRPHGGTVVATVVCGDDHFARDPERAGGELLALIRQARPSALLAGPAFNAGRYGLACGEVCRLAGAELGLPAVTAMCPGQPAVDAYRRQVLIARGSASAAGMQADLDRMVGLLARLAGGETLGTPDEEGYIPRGLRRTHPLERVAARRGSDMLLAKLAGRPFTSEIPLPAFGEVPRAPAVPDLRRARLALATTGGIVPRGNPDRQRSYMADRIRRYPLPDPEALDALEADHGGFYTAHVNQDFNRLLPVDAARQLEREGALGGLYPYFFTLAGNGTDPRVAEELARGIVPRLRQDGVDAVLLTST